MINKFKKEKKTTSAGNTFYREGLSSGQIKEPYNLKKFGKHSFKAVKYGTYGFLAVTAVWGCVDGFLIKTDPIVSRGMEVFANHEEVLPNLFATVPEIGYRFVAPEINPLVFNEQTATALEYSNFNSATEDIYIAADSEMDSEELLEGLEDGDFTTIAEAEALGATFTDSSILATTPAMEALRIMPYYKVNPYISLIESLWYEYEDNGLTAQEWQEMNYGSSTTLTGLTPPQQYDEDNKPTWSQTNPIDPTMTNDTFSKESMYIDSTEYSDPMSLGGANGETTEYQTILDVMSNSSGNSDFEDYLNSRMTPSNMKQISSTDFATMDVFMTIDYQGGVIDQYDYLTATVAGNDTAATPVTEVEYLGGHTAWQDPNYDSENEAHPDVEATYNNALFYYETAVDEGMKSATEILATDAPAYRSLNLTRWSQADADEDEGDLITDELVGEYKYRNDALQYAANIMSFISTTEVSVDDINQLVFVDNAEELDYETANDWVDAGVVLLEDMYLGTPNQEIYLGTDYNSTTDNPHVYDETYKADIYSLVNTTLTNAQANLKYGVADKGYYSDAELQTGTSYITVGHYISEGFQIVPSQETLAYAKEDRGNNATDQQSENKEGVTVKDGKVLNAGYTFMDSEGEIIKLYDEEDLVSGQFSNTGVNTVNTNVSEAPLDHVDGQKDALTAQQLTPGMGQHSQKDMDSGTEGASTDDSIDSFIQNTEKTRGPPGLNLGKFVEANYGTLELGEASNGEKLTLELEAATQFMGLSELDEAAISPYTVTREGTYYYNSTTDEANESIMAAGNDSYNGERIALVEWGQAWSMSPFYGAFVWPLSKYSLAVQGVMPPSMGIWGVLLGIFIIVFSLRMLATLFSWKQNKNQAKMQEVQFQISKINAKYAAHKDNKTMKRRKQMETMALYRKAGVNPLGSIGSIFTTMPVFLAIWTIINALTVYKVATVGTLSLAVSPLTGIFAFGAAGVFIPIAAAIIAIQIISSKIPNWLSQKRQGIKNIDEATRAAMKKSQKTATIMTVVFVIMGLTVPTLLGIYWMYSGLFTIGLNLVQHHFALKASRTKHLAPKENKIKGWVTEKWGSITNKNVDTVKIK